MQSSAPDSVAVVELSGRLDSHTVEQLKSQIALNIGARPVYLILDLSDVSFIDSRALAAIVQGMHSCQSKNGELCLSGPNKSVRRILELTRLDKAMKIFSSKSEAVASYEERLIE